MGLPWEKPISPLKGLTIMVNPGHGVTKSNGKPDDGAIIKFKDKPPVIESELNDANALKIKEKLEKLGANVIYADNMHVLDVQDLENKIKPDLFVAIHQDNYPTSAAYGETLYACTEESLKAAKFINEKLKSDTSIANRPINSKNINLAKSYKVLNADKSIPSVLVELGYMSSPKDLKHLTSPEYQEIAAEKIVEGISDFFEAKYPQRTKIEPIQRIYVKSIFEYTNQTSNKNALIIENNNKL